MGEWLIQDQDYACDAAARGTKLQEDAAHFWTRLFDVLRGEQAPFDRVIVERWDHRAIAYALQKGRPVGYDTGWRLQCLLPESVPVGTAWIHFLGGAGRGPAVASYRALRKARPGLVFNQSDHGGGIGQRLPL